MRPSTGRRLSNLHSQMKCQTCTSSKIAVIPAVELILCGFWEGARSFWHHHNATQCGSNSSYEANGRAEWKPVRARMNRRYGCSIGYYVKARISGSDDEHYMEKSAPRRNFNKPDGFVKHCPAKPPPSFQQLGIGKSLAYSLLDHA